MVKDEPGRRTRAWSQKINPSRAKIEAAAAESQRGRQDMFSALFGAPDVALQEELADSIAKIASIGNAIMYRTKANVLEEAE